MVFISIIMAMALVIGTACSTPLAEAVELGNGLARRQTVVCHSNNAVLQALREPQNASEASAFCSLYIQSTISTTATTTATTYVATQTTTPPPVVVSETTTDVSTTTVTAHAFTKRQARAEHPLPSYLTKFKPDRVSSACSCIVTADTTTSTITATATASDTATTTADAPTMTTTTTVSTVETTTVAPACPTTAVKNGHFDEGFSSWRRDEHHQWGGTFAFGDLVKGGYLIWFRCGGLGPAGDFSYTALEQTLDTCPGVTYDISFRYVIAINLPTALFNAFVDGTSVVSLRNPEDGPHEDWSQAKGFFTAKESTAVLKFMPSCNTDPFGFEQFFLDDVVVTPRLGER